jgi:hypothetical protein
MTTITTTYTKDTPSTIAGATRERTGGPRGELPEAAADAIEYFTNATPFGSHMPLDIQMHWDWRNPLNIIPAFVALMFVLGVIGMLIR